jgi:hypothetical protein
MSSSEINQLVEEALEAELTSKTYFMKQEYGPHDYYEGNWDSGTDSYHGFGKLQLPNNLGYVGYWKKGQYHGDNEDNVLRTEDTYYKGGFFEGLYHGKNCKLREKTIKYDGGFYKGEYHGRICKLFESKTEDGTIIEYEGGMSNGLYSNGKHTCKLKVTKTKDNSTQEYTGGMISGLFSGKGKLKMFDSTKYEGGFKAGQFHGAGHLMTKIYMYKGYFINGAYHGNGELKWLSASHVDKKIEKGGFKNGILHGNKCSITYKNGAKYTGSVQYGLFTGQGTFFNEEKQKVYQGQWLENKYHGFGKTFRLDDGSISYEGNFLRGLKHGQGKYIRKDGSVQYAGTSTNDRMTGTGTLFFSSGATYVGEIVEKIPHGFGVKTDKFGNVFKGWFRDGKRFRAYVKPKTPRSGSTKRRTTIPKSSSLSDSIPSNINGNDHPTSTDNPVRNLNTPGTNYSYHPNAIDNRPATALFLPPVNIFRRDSVASNVNNRPTSSMHWSNR